MRNTLFIPKKINVGFQKRDDTYTGKLSYIIYYDEKGVLRKEKSWQNWRDSKIPNTEFDNKPMSGFVINKNVGGYKSDWNYRNAYIRIYDPRDFEFEISLENLLFILQEYNSIKGKGLEGEFVYAWSGTDLVLLPTSSETYKVSTESTELQNTNVLAKDLVKGYTYIGKDMEEYVYIDRLKCYNIDNKHFNYKYDPNGKVKTDFLKSCINNAKKYIFIDGEKKLHYANNLKFLSKPIIESVDPKYAFYVDKHLKSFYGSKIVNINLEKIDVSKLKFDCYYNYNRNYFGIIDNKIINYTVSGNSYIDKYNYRVTYHSYVLLEKEKFCIYNISERTRHNYYYHSVDVYDIPNEQFKNNAHELYATLESGEKFKYNNSKFERVT